MILAELTWQQVSALSRDVVVIVPTGSLEQHGPHLPLFTDTLLATAVAEAVESQLPQETLLTPTHWLGCSGHHLKFPGTLSNSFEAYMDSLIQTAECLMVHGFNRFYFLNGHGGNDSANDIVSRKLKAAHLNAVFCATGYFDFISETLMKETMDGAVKHMEHACEAEASLMLHLHPALVHIDKLRDDGLLPDPEIKGLTLHFDELTEEGSFGFSSLATADKGKVLFEAAVGGVVAQTKALYEGFVLTGI